MSSYTGILEREKEREIFNIFFSDWMSQREATIIFTGKKDSHVSNTVGFYFHRFLKKGMLDCELIRKVGKSRTKFGKLREYPSIKKRYMANLKFYFEKKGIKDREIQNLLNLILEFPEMRGFIKRIIKNEKTDIITAIDIAFTRTFVKYSLSYATYLQEFRTLIKDDRYKMLLMPELHDFYYVPIPEGGKKELFEKDYPCCRKNEDFINHIKKIRTGLSKYLKAKKATSKERKEMIENLLNFDFYYRFQNDDEKWKIDNCGEWFDKEAIEKFFDILCITTRLDIQISACFHIIPTYMRQNMANLIVRLQARFNIVGDFSQKGSFTNLFTNEEILEIIRKDYLPYFQEKKDCLVHFARKWIEYVNILIISADLWEGDFESAERCIAKHRSGFCLFEFTGRLNYLKAKDVADDMAEKGLKNIS